MSNTSNSTPVRYGLPYRGSKNAIARWVVDHLLAAALRAKMNEYERTTANNIS